MEPPSRICLLCRIRRVKCDRGKPSCGRCEKLRVVCSYVPGDFSDQEAMTEQARAIMAAAGKHKRQVGSCMDCRLAKIRCNQERPECARCMRLGLTCNYDAGKRGEGPQYKPHRSLVEIEAMEAAAKAEAAAVAAAEAAGLPPPPKKPRRRKKAQILADAQAKAQAEAEAQAQLQTEAEAAGEAQVQAQVQVQVPTGMQAQIPTLPELKPQRLPPPQTRPAVHPPLQSWPTPHMDLPVPQEGMPPPQEFVFHTTVSTDMAGKDYTKMFRGHGSYA